jgi:hypothetical protein
MGIKKIPTKATARNLDHYTLPVNQIVAVGLFCQTVRRLMMVPLNIKSAADRIRFAYYCQVV